MGYINHREQRESQAWAILSQQSKPIRLIDVVEDLYPDIQPDRLWMAKGNIEAIFRKFVADGAASAWTTAESGVGALVPAKMPSAYSERNLPEDVFFAAR